MRARRRYLMSSVQFFEMARYERIDQFMILVGIHCGSHRDIMKWRLQ